MRLKNLLLVSLFVSTSASAQINIQGSALNGWSPADTITDLTNVSASATPNSTWDLSTATYGTGKFGTTDHIATHPSFTSAGYAKHTSYGFSFVGYLATLYYGKNNNGVYSYGEQIDRQAYSIASVTMDTQDSLVFPKQTITYSAPEKHLSFPMSFGGNWSNSIKYNTQFELTVTMYGLTKTPGERRTRLESRDSVKGWGKMRLNNVKGQTSAYIDVLAVQEREYVTDSFYLGGNPAPATLLNAFGLSQGQAQSRFTTKFFRSGEVTPLLRIEHADSTFTTTTGFVAMVNRLYPPSTGLDNINADNVVNLYPNPVPGGLLHITILKSDSNWSYSITSLNGQVLNQGKLTSGDNTVNISDLSAGVYNCIIFKEGVSQGGQFVIKQ